MNELHTLHTDQIQNSAPLLNNSTFYTFESNRGVGGFLPRDPRLVGWFMGTCGSHWRLLCVAVPLWPRAPGLVAASADAPAGVAVPAVDGLPGWLVGW